MSAPSIGSPRRAIRRRVVVLLLGLLLGAVQQSTVTQSALSIGSYQLVQEVRLDKGGVEFVYRATLTNAGPAIAGATATAVSLSPKLTLLDNTLTFGPVPAGGSAVSLETFSLTKNGRGMFDPALVAWTITAQPFNQPPQVNAGPDLSVTLPRSATLAGSATDDGLPAPAALSVSWTQQSGPGVVTFADATSAQTTAAFSMPGTYVLRLTAHDGAASAFDETTVVAEPNQPPVASAGPDQTAPLGATVTLNGGGSTDANGDPLTFLWSFSSRPAGSSATLVDPASVTPQFTIDLPGTYAIDLVVSDGFDSSAPDQVVVSTSNSAPVANAGPDQTGFVTQTITLDGSLSSDVDGDQLSLAWGFLSRPAGSMAMLDDATAVKPTFTIDVFGTYEVMLVVHDGQEGSVADVVQVTTLNSPPVANAGSDQTVFVGGTVTLDGTVSTDVDGNLLSYAWSLTTVPAGSTATLSDSTQPIATFVADRSGTYVAQLIVHDGSVSSTPDTVMITTRNSPPVAAAGVDQSVVAGAQVALNGGGSSDVDGDALTYAWSLTSVPDGSNATIAPADSATPSFVADRPGTYVVQLIVHDGSVSSAPDTVSISTTNSAPLASPGADRFGVPLQVPMMLDGSGSSDPDGHVLSFAWSLLSRPASSQAALTGAATVTSAFTPDVAGDYVVQLIVNDGYVDSAPETVLVRTNNPPVANAGADRSAQVGATVTFDGGGSSDPDGNPISYSWTLTSKPAASTAALAHAETSSPSFVPDVEGAYGVALTVTDSVGDTGLDAIVVTAFGTPIVTVAALDAEASETGPDPGVFRLTRTGDPAGSLTVDVVLAGTSDTADYAAVPASATFAPGSSTVDVPLTPIDDGLVETAETVTLTVLDGATYDPGTPASAIVTIADNDQHAVALALVNAAVVAVGGTAALEVALPEDAPAGGTLVTVTSDDPAVVSVGDPGTVVIPEGESTGQIVLAGAGEGATTLRANAVGFNEGTLAVTATNNLIALPVSANVPLGQSASLPIMITRDTGNAAEVEVAITSDAPGTVGILTPLVTIPAGQFTANATVFGAGIGSATVRATAPGFVADDTAVSATAALDITVAALTINNAFGGSITIELESPPGSPVAAPAGGLTVSLEAADPACVLVPASVQIAQGTTSATANVSYAGTAAVPCMTAVTATAPAGVSPDSVTVTVEPAPGITVPALGSIGAGLQRSPVAGTVGVTNHGGIVVRVTSGDASRILVAPDATTAGGGFIDVQVPDGSAGFSFVLQGVDWSPGSSPAQVTITASAEGFADGTNTVQYVQPALRIIALPAATTALSANTAFRVEVGVPVAGNGTLATGQARRAGAASLVATVTNGTAPVAELDPPGGGAGAQSSTVDVAAGQSLSPSGAIEFDPLDVGATIVSASIPGFISTTAASVAVEVSGAAITVNATGSLGGGLQAGPFTARLGASDHGGVTVRIASNDPTRVLVARSGTSTGEPFIDVDVDDGDTAAMFFVQGTDWGAGSSAASVTITGSAPGFTAGTAGVTYVQPALRLAALPSTTTSLSANTHFRVEVGVALAGNATLAALQERRSGGGALTVQVANSAAAVAELDPDGGGAGAQSRTVAIPEAAFASSSGAGGIEFDPLGVGSTTVSASIPGFITTAAGSQTVSVTGAGITVPLLGSLGGGLQHGPYTAQLGAPNHGGVTVRVTSSDPARVLVAPNASTVGAAFIDVQVANGTTAFGFVLQGADWVSPGSSAAGVTITASASGFADGSNSVSYVQPGTRLVAVPAVTTTLSANIDFRVEVGVPTSNGANLAPLQERRAGGSPLTATVTNTAASVAEIDPNGGGAGAQTRNAAIVAGAFATPSNTTGGLELDPLGSGTTVVSASIPGFVATGASSVTVTVSAPAITVPAMGGLGAGLQNLIGASLQVSTHGGVTVHLTSSDPTRVLLAPDASTVGTPELNIFVPNNSNSFNYVVQAFDWVDGVSSQATVTVTATAPGFVDDSNTVTYQRAGLRLSGLVTTTTAGAVNDDFTVQVGVPTAGNASVSAQERRAGAPALTVTVTNGNAAAAELDPNGGATPGSQERTANITPGVSSTPSNAAGGLEFDPLGPGTTTVSASIPGFITTTAGSQIVTVNP